MSKKIPEKAIDFFIDHSCCTSTVVNEKINEIDYDSKKFVYYMKKCNGPGTGTFLKNGKAIYHYDNENIYEEESSEHDGINEVVTVNLIKKEIEYKH